MLYLNPALKIYSMGEEGKKLSFHREQQLVVIERPLLPGDSVTLQLAYRGKIDETICYPDISWENKQSAGKYEPRSRLKGLFNFGVHYAFADERYTLLLPGCLWYPVTVPPVNDDLSLCAGSEFLGIFVTSEGRGGTAGFVARYFVAQIWERGFQKRTEITGNKPLYRQLSEERSSGGRY